MTETATAQRLSKVDRGSFARRKTDAKTDAPHDRLIPIFENMARRGHITVAERNAGERYAHFWYGARRQPGLVSSYGDQRWSGTTAGHSSITTEEWPIYCGQELARANAAIGDPRMVKNLGYIVERDATLADIGHEWLGCKSPQQAMAAGAALIKLGLGRLAEHWGLQQRGGP